MDTLTILTSDASHVSQWRANYLYWLTLLILAIAGCVFVLAATREYGVGTSPDSISYVAAARSLQEDRGFRSIGDTPIADWPPLYPFILSIYPATNPFGVLGPARVLNALLFASIIFLTGVLAYQLKINLAFALAATALVAFAYPLQSVSAMAWTEPLFIMLTLTFIVSGIAFGSGKSRSYLIVAATAAALAALTRYIGISIVIAGAVWLFFFSTLPFKTRLKNTICFLVISATPLAFWLIRNLVATGTLMGERYASAFSFAENLDLTLTTIANWYLPAFLNSFVDYFLLGMLATIVTGTVLVFLDRDQREARPAANTRTPVVLFVISYLAFLILSSTTTAYDKLGDRLLAPVYVPITLLFFTVASMVFARISRFAATTFVYFVTSLVLAVALLSPLRTTYRFISDLNRTGVGYTSVQWRESETLHYLQEHPLNDADVIYTNDPFSLYLYLELDTKLVPLKTAYNSSVVLSDLRQLEGSWPETEPAKLIWFDTIHRPYLFQPEELCRIASFGPSKALSDGALYSVLQGDGRCS